MTIPTSIEIEPISHASSNYPGFNKAIDELNAFIWVTMGGTDHYYRKGDNPYSFYISWGVIDNTLRVKEITGTLDRKEYKICSGLEDVTLFLPIGLYVFSRSSNHGTFQGLSDSATYADAVTKSVMSAERETEAADFILRLIETINTRIAQE